METKLIRISVELKKELDEAKLVPNETYDNIIKRKIKVAK